MDDMFLIQLALVIALALLVTAFIWIFNLKRYIKHKNASQHQAETIYKSIFNAADDAIVLYDPEIEKIVAFNPSFCDLFGVSPEDVPQRHLNIIYPSAPPYSIQDAQIKHKEALQRKGVTVIKSPVKNGKITENFVVKKLYNLGIMSVLIEGGSAVTTSFLCKKLVDEAWLYIAPKIIGADGLHYFGNMGFREMSKVFSLKNTFLERIGDDVLIKGKVMYK